MKQENQGLLGYRELKQRWNHISQDKMFKMQNVKGVGEELVQLNKVGASDCHMVAKRKT